MQQFHTSVQHNQQVGARAASIAETPITQVDLRPTSTDSESTPNVPQNPVRIWVDFRDGPNSPPAQSRVSSMNVLRQFASFDFETTFHT